MERISTPSAPKPHSLDTYQIGSQITPARTVGQEIFYDVAMRRLDEQSARCDALDNKATAVFTLSNGILALFGAILAATSWPTGLGLWLFLVLLFAATGMYIVASIYSYKALQVRRFSMRPDLLKLRAVAARESADEVHRLVAEQCLLSIRDNDPRLERKASYLTSALMYLPAESLLLLAASLVLIAAK